MKNALIIGFILLGGVALFVGALYFIAPHFDTGSYPTIPVTPSVSKAEQAVLDEGYTDPVETGTPIFSCSDSDSIINSREFDAKNSNGKTVHLIACCGWLKGCTIRH